MNAPKQPIQRDVNDEFDQITDDDLQKLALIRSFEQLLLDLFSAGDLDGTTHTCMGQEFVPVAISPVLRAADFVFSNHRGHGHYLARFDDPEGLLAEIMGREGAICGGIGGSQHIKRANYLSTGVQGESVGVAVGVALNAKQRRTGGLALAYIGDGTWGQGLVYEALNLASLWQVPLAVVVENNGIAQTTPINSNLAGSIEARVRAFDIDYARVDLTAGAALPKLRDVAQQKLDVCRSDFRPVVIECIVDRLGPHSKGDDTRDEGTQAAIRARDWLPRFRQKIPNRFAPILEAVTSRVRTIAHEVRARPLVRS